MRILAVADEPSTGIGRVGSLAGEPSAGIGVVPCPSCRGPMNPLQGSGVSARSRCGAVRILAVADEPSTGIGRVGSLAGEPSAGIGVVPCASLPWPLNPLQDRACRIARRRTLCGDRCGAVRILAVADEPSTGIGRVGSLAGEPSAGIGVVPCPSCRGPMNPLQGSGVSARSRCGAVRILAVADEPSTGIGRVGSLAGEPSAGIGVVPCPSLPWTDEPSTGIGRVGALALWCRAHPCRGR